MDRTERFYKIDQLLRDGKAVPFVQLADALGVSPATVKRDLAYMRDRLNAPVEYDRASNGYRFGTPRSGPRYELPGMWFSAEEGYALLTTLRLLGDLQPGLLANEIPQVVTRLRKVVGGGDNTWQEVQERIRIFHPERRSAAAAQFPVIAAALLKRRRVHIQHYNRGEDRTTERDISPQRLIHYRDNWYVDAYCHMREGLRSFAVDAISVAALLDAPAREVSHSELDASLAGGYGIFAGHVRDRAILKFSSKMARWVSSQTWHPDQRHHLESDGSYVLEVPYADDRELAMEILKYGADVEVLSPAALRSRVARTLSDAVRAYSRD